MTNNNFHSIPNDFFYRCAFPRGRMLQKIEDDLTLFVQLIAKHRGKNKDEFNCEFDKEYKSFHAEADKTIQNHRTEMIKLYGLTNITEEGLVQPTFRALRLLENQDYYEFFKIFCNKFQFPNGINKTQVVTEMLEKKIHFKPAKYILKMLQIGNIKTNMNFMVSGQEIANLVFNDTRVTTGKISESDMVEIVIANRKNHTLYEGGSNAVQHGREFLGYMTLANLLIHDEETNAFYLNPNEQLAINYILNDNTFFEIPDTFLANAEERKKIQLQWDIWYGAITEEELTNLCTTEIAIREKAIEITQAPDVQGNITQPISVDNLKDIGDLGERIVLKYEKENIGRLRPDKIGLVQLVSNDTALGFDIQSLEFTDVSKKKLIEVKTTNRTYPPDLEIITAFPMSANEWESARLYGKSYYIYRVFLISKNVKIYIVNDPVKKEQDGLIILEPTGYRVHLKQNCGSFVSN